MQGMLVEEIVGGEDIWSEQRRKSHELQLERERGNLEVELEKMRLQAGAGTAAAERQARDLSERRRLAAGERMAAFEADQQAQARNQQLALQYDQLGRQAQAQQQSQYLDTMRLGSQIWEADQDRAMRADQFNRQQGQREYEFDTESGRRAYEFDAQQGQRAYEFDQSRQPSDRDRWAADQEAMQRDEQRNFAAQEMQARYSMQAWLNQQELTQAEENRRQRLLWGASQVEEMVQAGQLTAQEGAAMMATIKTGLDPLQSRMTNAQIGRMQAQQQMEDRQIAIQEAREARNRQFQAKSMQDRVQLIKNPETGETVGMFYQNDIDSITPLPFKNTREAAEMASQERFAKAEEARRKDWEAKKDKIERSREEADKSWRGYLDRAMDEEDKIINSLEEKALESDDPDLAKRLEERKINRDKNVAKKLSRKFSFLTGQNIGELESIDQLNDLYRMHLEGRYVVPEFTPGQYQRPQEQQTQPEQQPPPDGTWPPKESYGGYGGRENWPQGQTGEFQSPAQPPQAQPQPPRPAPPVQRPMSIEERARMMQPPAPLSKGKITTTEMPGGQKVREWSPPAWKGPSDAAASAGQAATQQEGIQPGDEQIVQLYGSGFPGARYDEAEPAKLDRAPEQLRPTLERLGARWNAIKEKWNKGEISQAKGVAAIEAMAYVQDALLRYGGIDSMPEGERESYVRALKIIASVRE